MEDLEMRPVKNKEELNEVLKIREEVFIKGQKVPEERDRDGWDDSSEHIIVLCDGLPIGCSRVRFAGSKAKLERIAIIDSFQGKGIGKILMNYLILYSKKDNIETIFLHAQYPTRKFYEKFGFREKGDKFMDAGIEHIEMEMEVQNSKP